tara:strand:+ start:150 stop:662 length:513 start_codon:yes stop_codon:yes gene_type:complete
MLLEYRKLSFIGGVILSFLLSFITTLFYLFDSDKLHETLFYPGFFYCILLLFPIIVLIQKIKTKNYIFKDIFSIVFLMLSVALLGHMLFTLLLYNIIDKHLVVHFIDVKMTEYVNLIHQGGVLSPDLENDIYNSLLVNFSIKSQFNSYIFSLIPCVLYSALISLLFKIKK